MQREIKVLTKGLYEVDERKARIHKESKFMQGSTMDEENKKIEPQQYSRIEELVKDLYCLCVSERGDAKMNNASVLQLLNEIEKNVDKYLQEFKYSEKICEEDLKQDIVGEEITKIKKEQRKENRQKVLEKERLENERK